MSRKTTPTLRNQIKIGRFIATLRQQKGLTQKELADRLNTSQSAVARMEKGEQNFSTEMLSKISVALNKQIIRLGSQAINFRVEGGKKLHGEIQVRTSKNSAVALLCASLLNQNTTLLKNMPRIEEVNRIIEVLESIGVTVKWLANNDLQITPPKKIKLDQLNIESAVKTRSILMFLGPLIHLLPQFKLPFSGGCQLGRRIVEPHLYALENLGVNIDTNHGFHRVQVNKLHPAKIVMYESGDTATENALMAAAKIPGKTTIKFASANYQVQDLCLFLQQLGVKIHGLGTTTLVIEGQPHINRRVEFYPSEDPIEAMLFISIAATTNSSIIIKGCPIDFLELELLKLGKMGFKYEILKHYLAQNGHTKLVDIKTLPSKLKALDHKLYGRPYPGLNIDNLPLFVPIATQARGETFIHDWVYENRAIYYTELEKLGAQVRLVDPHRVYIKGPTKLQAAEVVCPPALRPATIILIGMLAAKGTSILRNVYSINRGYEDLANRLQTLGAKIEIMRGL